MSLSWASRPTPRCPLYPTTATETAKRKKKAPASLTPVPVGRGFLDAPSTSRPLRSARCISNGMSTHTAPSRGAVSEPAAWRSRDREMECRDVFYLSDAKTAKTASVHRPVKLHLDCDLDLDLDGATTENPRAFSPAAASVSPSASQPRPDGHQGQRGLVRIGLESITKQQGVSAAPSAGTQQSKTRH
jgi:hypothetical protein